jgi:ribosomal protein S24E
MLQALPYSYYPVMQLLERVNFGAWVGEKRKKKCLISVFRPKRSYGMGLSVCLTHLYCTSNRLSKGNKPYLLKHLEIYLLHLTKYETNNKLKKYVNEALLHDDLDFSA